METSTRTDVSNYRYTKIFNRRHSSFVLTGMEEMIDETFFKRVCLVISIKLMVLSQFLPATFPQMHSFHITELTLSNRVMFFITYFCFGHWFMQKILHYDFMNLYHDKTLNYDYTARTSKMAQVLHLSSVSKLLEHLNPDNSAHCFTSKHFDSVCCQVYFYI